MSIEDQITRTAEHLVTIRFPQVDAAGIVFYPRYFEMAFKNFPNVPFVHTPFAIETRFLRPNRLGDRLRLALEHNAGMSEWSLTGRMNGEEHFSIRPLPPEEAKLSPVAHQSEKAPFSTEPERVGEWTAGRDARMLMSRYFEVHNMAVEEWFEQTLDLPFHALHVGRNVGIPTVMFTTRCRELPMVGDKTNMLIRPTKLGNRAMSLTSWFVRGDECLIENEQVVVFVRMLENGYESIPIPDDIRAAFELQLKDEAARQ